MNKKLNNSTENESDYPSYIFLRTYEAVRTIYFHVMKDDKTHWNIIIYIPT